MIGLQFDKARTFFDKEEVVRRLAPAKRQALNRGGGMLRQTMRRSMRLRKKASAPGSPPSAHRQDEQHPRGPLLKDRLYYAFDAAQESVVTGPEQLGRSDAPDDLEHGGEGRTRIPKRRSGVKRTRLTPAALAAFKRKLAAGTIKRKLVPFRTFKIDARPFAAPALETERPKLAGLFADVI